jgi:large subunit ribosomal protein L23
MTEKDVSDQELDRLLEKEEERIKREKQAKEEKAPEKPQAEKPQAQPGEKPAGKPERPEAKPAPVMGDYNPWGVLMYPHLAEKSMNMVEMDNKLVFIVSKKANKKDIKEAIEKGFDVKVRGIKTEITTRGQKKAYIKLAEGYEAADVASRLGMI